MTLCIVSAPKSTMQQSDGSKNKYDNVISSQSIAEAFWKRASVTPDAPLIRYALAPSPSATRIWRQESYNSVAPKIAHFAAFLQSLGAGVGTPVAILSQTRREWCIADMAIQSIGAVTVSVYQSLPAPDAGYILFDSSARIILVENEEQASKIAWLQENACPIPEREGEPSTEVRLSFSTIISFEKVDSLPGVTHFDSIINEDSPITPPQVPPELTRDSIASIVYTSGTTGPPKGVLQTHGNHLSNVQQAAESGVFLLDGSLFLYLPLAHSFARLAYYLGFLTSASLVIPSVADHRTSKIELTGIANDLREAGASVVPSVPRLFEKMAAVLLTKSKKSGLQSRILRLCIHSATAVYKSRSEGKPLTLLQQIVFEGLSGVRRKIKAQLFGDGFFHGIAGGAKLDPEVNRLFDALGILILEGYGLTETCVATHVNLPTRRRIGTVGPPFNDVEVMIDPNDGEILMRGPNVTKSYHNRPQATAEAWTSDGWFKTGDIGSVDPEGFLRITDRKKELIVTAGGKKIAPQGIEGLFKRCPIISQAFLFGDGKPYCIMLFTVNDAEARSILGLPLDVQLHLSHEVKTTIQAEVERANQELASFETIKRFEILAEDFTIDNGLLTPTLKIKRRKVVDKYQDIIEGLYR